MRSPHQLALTHLVSTEHEGDVNEIATLFVERADRALYQAKNNGRNRIEFYTGSVVIRILNSCTFSKGHGDNTLIRKLRTKHKIDNDALVT